MGKMFSMGPFLKCHTLSGTLCQVLWRIQTKLFSSVDFHLFYSSDDIQRINMLLLQSVVQEQTHTNKHTQVTCGAPEEAASVKCNFNHTGQRPKHFNCWDIQTLWQCCRGKTMTLVWFKCSNASIINSFSLQIA